MTALILVHIWLFRLTGASRTIDASTAAGVKELGLKVSHGTTASLSKIEKQNDMLQRIESYSQTGMQSSAASVRSLQTIATSLSRLEAMACSAERSSRHQSIDNGEDRIDETNFKRSSSDEIEYQSRRSSSGSAVAKKSSYASLRKSAVGVGPPTIHEEAMGSSISSEGDSPLNLPYSMRRHQRRMRRIRRIRRMRSNPEGFENREISLGTDSDVDRWRADEPHSDVASDAPGRLSCILSQDRCATHIWDALSEQHPDVVIEYIALARKARILQNKLDTLYLLNLGSNVNISMTSRLEVDAPQIERDTMQGSLHEVLHQLRIARIRCVSEGYSLYEFDKRLRPPISNDHPGSFWDQLNEPDENQARNRYLVKMCDSDDSVYGDWSDKYDRINHWMLHCLRSDDTQTQLHRFMLAEPPPDDECWARQVLDHWLIDGAVGGFVEIAHSAGAVDSREISQLERPISDPGPDIRRNDELDQATIFLSGILSF